MAGSWLKSGFVFVLCFIFLFSTLPAQAAPRPPKSGVEIVTDEESGGTGGAAVVDAEPLEGAALASAVAWATSDDAFFEARLELTTGRDLHQDISLAAAFAGKCGTGGKEVEVVLIPFPDAKRPETKSGFIAVARADSKTKVSYCIIERAVSPSEPGAVSLEIPIDDPDGGKAWIWIPEEGPGKSTISKARQYFKCVVRTTALGCSLCVTRCVVSMMFFVECMKHCCGGAFAFAVISCAFEMMFQ
jgi:hypothetical protein